MLLSNAVLTLCHIRLTHAIFTLCCTQLSYAILTLCHTLRSQAILTPCHTLLSHAILTLCFNLLSHAVLTLCHMLLSNAVRTYIVPYSTDRLLWYKQLCHPICTQRNTQTYLDISPNQRDKKQIDHLLISGKWRRSLQDVRFRRGADVGSNHHLVVAHIKLKLNRTV